ncbi:hypothetical protein AB0I16_25830 [Streptomyces sp. NPDC050703]|uniref:hypothetical protein n=1 Tax=Streptomyces sp. NPDC050703 TaxID=3157218 RepID=UPI00341795BE
MSMDERTDAVDVGRGPGGEYAAGTPAEDRNGWALPRATSPRGRTRGPVGGAVPHAPGGAAQGALR